MAIQKEKFISALNGNINVITISGMVSKGKNKKITSKVVTTEVNHSGKDKITAKLTFPRSDINTYNNVIKMMENINKYMNTSEYDSEKGCFYLLITPNNDKIHHLIIQSFEFYETAKTDSDKGILNITAKAEDVGIMENM